MPSRASVHNVVRKWENEAPNVRLRDLPFHLHEVDKARLPWEASAWVAECQRILESFHVIITRGDEMPSGSNVPTKEFVATLPRFTNRWAAWCWRTHQMVPDLSAIEILMVANIYAREEQSRDLLPQNPRMNAEGLDSWMVFRPDTEGQEAALTYLHAIRLGIASPVPSRQELSARERLLTEVIGASPTWWSTDPGRMFADYAADSWAVTLERMEATESQ